MTRHAGDLEQEAIVLSLTRSRMAKVSLGIDKVQSLRVATDLSWFLHHLPNTDDELAKRRFRRSAPHFRARSRRTY